MRGGARTGAGRQAESGEAVIRKNLSVSQMDIDTLVNFGDGEFSRGVHRAAELVRKQATRKLKKSLPVV